MALNLSSGGADLGQNLPDHCTLLTAGQTFSGTQNITPQNAHLWNIEVYIQAYDPEESYLCGTMEYSKPSDETVVTWWEGQILGSKNYTFITGKEEIEVTDKSHCVHFNSILSMMNQAAADGRMPMEPRDFQLITLRVVEIDLVKGSEECGLSVPGIYYVCLRVDNGSIAGYHYTPGCTIKPLGTYPTYVSVCTPEWIELNHKAENEGFRSSSYELR